MTVVKTRTSKVLLLCLLLGLLAIPQPAWAATSADAGVWNNLTFPGATAASCGVWRIGTAALVIDDTYEVQVWDGAGNTLFHFTGSGFGGATFTYDSNVFTTQPTRNPIRVRSVADGIVLADVKADNRCLPPTPIAGCDVQMPLPATAVVGALVADAPLYAEPGVAVSPALTLAAGKTAWVLGLDASGQYYKILWVCDFLWVPASSMGPNYDSVWQGRPLPSGVVK